MRNSLVHWKAYFYAFTYALENTEGEIKNGQSRETGNEDEHKHNTICVGHHYAHTNTNNENKTWALLQTTGGKDEPNIV